MNVRPIKTDRIMAGQYSLIELIDKFLSKLSENNVLVITSKIVSLCENQALPIKNTDKEKLIKKSAEYYLPPQTTRYGFSFTITQGTLIPMSGIDESNGGGNYILWPKNAQQTANEIRQYLKHRFGLKNVGVVITDSTCTPLRWGTSGIALAYSGFEAVNDYIGKPDLFGRKFKYSRANVAGGLAAAAVLVMGEGTEQTPMAIIEGLPFVKFQSRDPSPKDIELFKVVRIEDDLFAPFLNAVKWQKGSNK